MVDMDSVVKVGKNVLRGSGNRMTCKLDSMVHAALMEMKPEDLTVSEYIWSLLKQHRKYGVRRIFRDWPTELLPIADEGISQYVDRCMVYLAKNDCLFEHQISSQIASIGVYFYLCSRYTGNLNLFINELGLYKTRGKPLNRAITISPDILFGRDELEGWIEVKYLPAKAYGRDSRLVAYAKAYPELRKVVIAQDFVSRRYKKGELSWVEDLDTLGVEHVEMLRFSDLDGLVC